MKGVQERKMELLGPRRGETRGCKSSGAQEARREVEEIRYKGGISIQGDRLRRFIYTLNSVYYESISNRMIPGVRETQDL
jgi:hypothetical protein